jgi:hypothetical protein
LFLYFEISKSSISVVILGVFNFSMWSFIRGEIGYLLFFWKRQSSFVLIFWSSKVFNFLLIILGVFKKICVKSSQVRKHGMCLFFMWILKIFCFCILKIWNLQFSSCHFGGFTWGKIMLGVLF